MTGFAGRRLDVEAGQTLLSQRPEAQLINLVHAPAAVAPLLSSGHANRLQARPDRWRCRRWRYPGIRRHALYPPGRGRHGRGARPRHSPGRRRHGARAIPHRSRQTPCGLSGGTCPVRGQVGRRRARRHHDVEEAGVSRGPFQGDRHEAPRVLVVDHLRVEAARVPAEGVQVHRPGACVAAGDDTSRFVEDGDVAVGDLDDAAGPDGGLGVGRGVDEAVAIGLRSELRLVDQRRCLSAARQRQRHR